MRFKTKPELALEMIQRAVADGLPPGLVLADSAYGDSADFRRVLRCELPLKSFTAIGRSRAMAPHAMWLGGGDSSIDSFHAYRFRVAAVFVATQAIDYRRDVERWHKTRATTTRPVGRNACTAACRA